MSKKAKQYSATEKSKIVIEAIKGELTIAQISSKYGVHSTQIQQWKKKGLEYLESGFQNKVKSKHSDNEELIKQLYEQIGQLNMECNWLKKNLHCLEFKYRRDMINSTDKEISVAEQCKLLSISRSSYYYKPKSLSAEDLELMKIIDEIYTQHQYYGTRRMSKCLQSKGYATGRKVVRRYYRIMGIEAVYPKINLSKRNQAHKIYPYLLRDTKIERVNQVWSADITYIRLEQGFVYLVAIIDWYSRLYIELEAFNHLRF